MKKLLLILLALLLSMPAQAAVSVRLEDGSALLDASGSVIVDFGAWDDIVRLSADRFAAEQNGLYALLDAQGNALTETVYSDLRICGETVLACRDDLWGILTLHGTVRNDFQYTRLMDADAGRFWAIRTDPEDLNSDELFLLDASGRESSAGIFVRRTAEKASCGRLAVQVPETGLWGFCDPDGSLAVPAEYESVGRFTAGIAPVVQDGFWGAIDFDGKCIVPARYDSLEITEAGTILASVAGEGVRVFSPDGAQIAAHTEADAFAAAAGDGYAVYERDSASIFDAEGNERFTFSANASISEGLNGQILIADGPWGEENCFIAGTENRYRHLYPLAITVAGPLYACMSVNASEYMNELLGEVQLAVDMDSARWGTADANGALQLPMEYESLQYLGEDRLLVQTETQWQMLDLSGNVLWNHPINGDAEASF